MESTAESIKQNDIKACILQMAGRDEALAKVMHKEVLTTEEVADFLGISKAYVYKLTFKKLIPYHKPFGKLIFFDRSEVIQFAMKNRVSTDEEISERAANYSHKA